MSQLVDSEFKSNFKKAVKSGDVKKAVLLLFDNINMHRIDGSERIKLLDLSFNDGKLEYKYQYDLGDKKGSVKSYDPEGKYEPKEVIIALAMGLGRTINDIDPVTDWVYDYLQENDFGKPTSFALPITLLVMGFIAYKVTR